MKPWMKTGLPALVAAALLAMTSEGMLTHAQPDIATGQPNICYGDTHDVRPGDTATREECLVRLGARMRDAEKTVERCMPTPPNESVKAALEDFAYNEGAGKAGVKDGLCVLKNGRKPTIRRRAEAGDWRGVCDGLLAWTTAGGKEYPGLVTRRQRERELCLQGIK